MHATDEDHLVRSPWWIGLTQEGQGIFLSSAGRGSDFAELALESPARFRLGDGCG